MCAAVSYTHLDVYKRQIAGATGETLELTDALGGKYLKCKVSSKIGSSSLTNSTGALVAAAGSINVTSVTMSPTSGKVEVGSTITATAKAGSTDVTTDSHVTWQWYKGTSNYASSCNTPIELSLIHILPAPRSSRLHVTSCSIRGCRAPMRWRAAPLTPQGRGDSHG